MVRIAATYRVSVPTTVCTALLVPFTTLCPTFLAVSAVLFVTLAAVLTGPASTEPAETAIARMIEKNAFMVLKVSLLPAHVRVRLPISPRWRMRAGMVDESGPATLTRPRINCAS